MVDVDSITQHSMDLWVDRTLTFDEYREVIDNYPALQRNPAYMEAFKYIALQPKYDEDTGWIIVPHTLIGRWQGKRGKDARAEDFLKQLRRDVFPHLQVEKYSKDAKKCRAISYTGIVQLVERIAHNPSRERIYLNGSQSNYHNQLQRHKRNLSIAQRDMDNAPYPLQKMIGQYLHNLPLSFFRQTVCNNFTRAWDVALGLEQGQMEALQHLQAIWDMPMPLYHPVGLNPRLFPNAHSLATVKSEVRRALLYDMEELDIAACNIAIVAGIWKINSIQSLLQRGQSFWTAILDEMDIPQHQRAIAKPLLKKETHALTNGMKPAYAESAITEAFNKAGIKKNKRFIQCSLIADLLSAREEAIFTISRDKGCFGAFGWENYDECVEPISSFIARIVWTYELSIIGACFHLAEQKEKDFRIVCYSYDGFTIQVKRSTRKARIIKDIQEKARLEALKYGIYTSLEIHR